MATGSITKRTWVHEGRTHVAFQYSIAVNGKQVRKGGFESKAEAQTALDEYKEKLKGPKLTPMTLGEAIERYVATKATKTSIGNDKRALAAFAAAWGEQTPLSEITASKIDEWQVAALARHRVRHVSQGDQIVTPATVNRALAALRHMLRLAWRRWQAIAQPPYIALEKEPEGRERYLAEEEIARLLVACRHPRRNKHLADIVTVALNSGMRSGEILGLTWPQVDFSRGVISLGGSQTKSGKGRDIPMTKTVDALLAGLPGPHSGRVFPIYEVKSSYRCALADAKIDGARFHDLRHTFASHYMMRGGNLYDLSKILGHATLKMTMRYAKLSPEHLRVGMLRMDGITPSNSTRATHELGANTESPVVAVD